MAIASAAPPRARPEDFESLRRELEKQLFELEQRIQSPAPLNLSIHNNVTINVFGSESWQHIGSHQIKALLDCTMPMTDLVHTAPREQDVANFFKQTAMLIYSDTDHPENLTAYIPQHAGKQDQVMVYRGDVRNWEVVPLAQVTPPMTKNTLDLLQVRQPCDSGVRDVRDYSAFLRHVFDQQDRWVDGKELRAVLIKNGEILTAARA